MQKTILCTHLLTVLEKAKKEEIAMQSANDPKYEDPKSTAQSVSPSISFLVFR